MSINVYSALKHLKCLNLNKLCSVLRVGNHRFCSSASSSELILQIKYAAFTKKRLEDYFFDKNVQAILKKITGLNYEKLFSPRQMEIEPDKFEFVTEEKLKKMIDDTNAKAAAKLQMPPAMDIREEIDEVLSKDPELQYYLDSKLVFIDTSPSKTARSRIITVRETDGTLRKANWDERFKMNQIFFPIEGRELEVPKFFESLYLDKLLEEESYEFVLDSACVQFEPDDPEYHRVTSATYDHVKSRKMFDVLRSTRHFGSMAFYFAIKKDINPLLVDMLERNLIGDAADTIKLLHIVNPDLGAIDKDIDDTECVKNYLEKNKSEKTADLELALQTFLEAQQSVKSESATS